MDRILHYTLHFVKVPEGNFIAQRLFSYVLFKYQLFVSEGSA